MNIKKIITLSICILQMLSVFAQLNKSGNQWVSGSFAGVVKFKGDTTRPSNRYLFDTNSPCYPAAYFIFSSNICDSATGRLLFMCNGARIYDTAGHIMPNGDNLQSPQCYYDGGGGLYEQESIILPKGNNQYYVFVANFTDSVFFNYSSTFLPHDDELRVNIVDMTLRGGLGDVVVKNKIVGKNMATMLAGMHAIKHANGQDWWLLKMGMGSTFDTIALDSNIMYRWLVKPDTILGPFIQRIGKGHFSNPYPAQISFSADGSKITYGVGYDACYGDFDRCNGLCLNVKYIVQTRDSFGRYLDDTTLYLGYPDVGIYGICMSPNKRFIYVSNEQHITQYDLLDNSYYWLLRGADTTKDANGSFIQNMGNIGMGPDGRMYVSTRGTGIAWQVINNPDKKGDSCGFCVRCERPTSGIPTSLGGGQFQIQSFIGGLPNIPNFNLDGSNPNCWPLALEEALEQDKLMQIIPNPAMETFIVDKVSTNNIQLLNMLGQVMQVQTVTNNKATFNVGAYARGVYFVKADGQVLRVVLQ